MLEGFTLVLGAVIEMESYQTRKTVPKSRAASVCNSTIRFGKMCEEYFSSGYRRKNWKPAMDYESLGLLHMIARTGRGTGKIAFLVQEMQDPIG